MLPAQSTEAGQASARGHRWGSASIALALDPAGTASTWRSADEPLRLSDRLARLEQQRRGTAPDRQRLAEAEARLIEAVDQTHGLDELLAFRAVIAAVRREVGP